MRSFKQIKESYQFTKDDEQRLIDMRSLMEENVDEVMSALSLWILGSRETASFFDEEARRKHVFDSIRQWYLVLFSGQYDHKYYERLIRIGSVHVKNNVEAHYMNKAINIIRSVCINILSTSEEIREDLTQNVISFEKLLDINLDVITSSYIEEEVKTYSSLYKVKSALVEFAEKFSQTMNIVLVFALIGLTLSFVALFIMDLRDLVTGNVEQGIISALGSLLILWVMIELMNTEISHLKGGKFYISVFVGVALVAIIRETLIATLKHEKPETITYLIAAILVIGFIYWLVTRAESRNR
jgi:uncharacterized membrane protein (DUF373 family)